MKDTNGAWWYFLSNDCFEDNLPAYFNIVMYLLNIVVDSIIINITTTLKRLKRTGRQQR